MHSEQRKLLKEVKYSRNVISHKNSDFIKVVKVDLGPSQFPDKVS
jgi:hypothetical protein